MLSHAALKCLMSVGLCLYLPGLHNVPLVFFIVE